MKWLRQIAIVPALLVACGGEDEGPVPSGPPPDLRSMDTGGILRVLEQLRGKPVLVNFWAMWCAPCVAELPDLVAVAKDFRARGGEVVGISLDMVQRGATRPATLTRLDPFLRRRGIEFPILLLADGDPRRLNEHFALPGAVPVTLAIDSNGKVVATHEGQATRTDFEQLAATAAGR